ncbi:hypothetical protein VNO77_27625 [Canavalia gladiata]|uniref:Uncharacterized protein n=1 Tax=Canavalia gladiata TaxID=3824 RepID=A0AAN9KXM1_CANGL
MYGGCGISMEDQNRNSFFVDTEQISLNAVEVKQVWRFLPCSAANGVLLVIVPIGRQEKAPERFSYAMFGSHTK